PIGYISNTKDLLPDSWERYWKDPETRIINFIGKDNIVFHCIVFPAMMMAYGDGFQLPDNVPANEFLNLEGNKISTSKNWAVWLHEYLQDFPGRQDTLRYVLTANAPETKDNDFTWADFQAKNNNELVAVLGNFVNRALVLTHKYFDGVVPEPDTLQEIDEKLRKDVHDTVGRMADAIETFHFREAAKEMMEVARLGNRYLQETEPWKVAKTDMDRVRTILWCALQLCGHLAGAMEPFMPFAARKLADMLRIDKLDWTLEVAAAPVAAGTVLAPAELLFDKIDDEAIKAQLDRLERIKKENVIRNFKPEPQAADVDFDTFAKSDIRVGTVLECSKVKKASKLLKFLIDDGMEKRTIVSGIAAYYKPEDLVGKQVCFICNLPPRTLMGIESQGMILSADNADGSLVVIGPTAPVAPGAQVK
ncbi:MAG: methionine--tRNA ligase subunit beta, partial [Muribaculaceae bacterium]|nr:methionine--tRNA ligase subunit beta [Muribaculaceae bacterium]